MAGFNVKYAIDNDPKVQETFEVKESNVYGSLRLLEYRIEKEDDHIE